MSEHKSPIPSMLYNAAVGGHVTNSQQIIDENLNREQNDINQETVGSVPYNNTNPNGMGRVVLKKNDNFKEVIESQINGNTIFIIKYYFTLTDDVIVPANCVLEFDGGSISGEHTIIGNNTGINAGLVEIFNTDVIFAGNWKVSTIYDVWFETSVNDLRKVMMLCSDKIENIVIIDKNHTISVSEHSENYDPDSTANYQGDNGVNIKSNTNLIINGTLSLTANKYPWYHIINIQDKVNVKISGNGKIVGDKTNHNYSQDYPDYSTHEWGYGIFIGNSTNVSIIDIEIYETTADGVYISGGSGHVLQNLKVHDCKRSGLSITTSNSIIRKNTIYNIVDTEPKAGISIECEGYISECAYDVIDYNYIYNTGKGIELVRNSGYIHDVNISNNVVIDTNTAFRVESKVNNGTTNKNIVVSGNYFQGIDETVYVRDVDQYSFFNNIVYANKLLINSVIGIINNNKIYYTNLWYIHPSDVLIEGNDIINNNPFDGEFKNTLAQINITSSFDFGKISTPKCIFKGNNLSDIKLANTAYYTIFDGNLIERNGTPSYAFGYDFCFINNFIKVKYNSGTNVTLYSMPTTVKGVVKNNRISGYSIGSGNIVYPFPNNALSDVSDNHYVWQKSTDNSIYNSDKGVTNIRPVLSKYDGGFEYFDITIGKPIYWLVNTSYPNGAWVDATGTQV